MEHSPSNSYEREARLTRDIQTHTLNLQKPLYLLFHAGNSKFPENFRGKFKIPWKLSREIQNSLHLFPGNSEFPLHFRGKFKIPSPFSRNIRNSLKIFRGKFKHPSPLPRELKSPIQRYNNFNIWPHQPINFLITTQILIHRVRPPILTHPKS